MTNADLPNAPPQPPPPLPGRPPAAACAPATGHRPFLLVMLFIALGLTAYVLSPFLQTLIFAVVLASIFHPLHARLVRAFGGKENLAALLVVLVITFCLALPVLFFLSTIAAQGVQTLNDLNAWLKGGNLDRLLDDPRVIHLAAWARERLAFLDLHKVDIQGSLIEASKNFGQWLLTKGAGLLGDAAGLIARFLIMVFVTFFLVRDGSALVARIKYLSPLRESQEDRIIERIRRVNRSVIVGSFATAILEGAAGGLGFFFAGLPALFWGTMMALCSFIPVVGTALIWVPGALYLFLTGHWKAAVFVAGWFILVVGSIDNFVRPLLMGGKGGLSPFYIFLAILGGVNCFGLPGVLYGPLILSFAMVMLYIYSVEYRDLLEENGADHPGADPEEGA